MPVTRPDAGPSIPPVPPTPGPEPRPALPGWRNGPPLTRAALASSVRRYPKQLLDSLRPPRQNSAGELELEHEAASGPLSAAWMGHATVLLHVGGRWILTDPVMSPRVGVKLGPMTVGVSRLVPPFSLTRLPPIDWILISHAHFDHLDRPTLQRLASKHTRIMTAKHTRRLIPRGFGDVREIDWEQTTDLEGLELAAIRPNHWGARTAWDRHRGFNAYLLTAPGDTPRRVLFAGDTAYTDAFRVVGGTDLSIFGIGAYEPWIHAHASPEQVWDMHGQAGGRFLLPMHHSTFKLSDEPLDEPLMRLMAAAGEQSPRIVGAGLGQVWNEPAGPPPAPSP